MVFGNGGRLATDSPYSQLYRSDSGTWGKRVAPTELGTWTPVSGMAMVLAGKALCWMAPWDDEIVQFHVDT
jgi:hypothetical protein